MGPRRRLTALTSIALASISVAGTPACKRRVTPSATAAPSAAPNTDRLGKGEIPEGRERAFTLPLPLHSTVKARFPESVHVASTYTREDLANFVKARVKDGTTTSGASETRFDRVVVANDPSKTLTVQIRSAPIAGEFRSQIVVSDVTPAPEKPGTTDADRWRKAGMTPDGKLVDRNHLQ